MPSEIPFEVLTNVTKAETETTPLYNTLLSLLPLPEFLAEAADNWDLPELLALDDFDFSGSFVVNRVTLIGEKAGWISAGKGVCIKSVTSTIATGITVATSGFAAPLVLSVIGAGWSFYQVFRYNQDTWKRGQDRVVQHVKLIEPDTESLERAEQVVRWAAEGNDEQADIQVQKCGLGNTIHVRTWSFEDNAVIAGVKERSMASVETLLQDTTAHATIKDDNESMQQEPVKKDSREQWLVMGNADGVWKAVPLSCLGDGEDTWAGLGKIVIKSPDWRGFLVAQPTDVTSAYKPEHLTLPVFPTSPAATNDPSREESDKAPK